MCIEKINHELLPAYRKAPFFIKELAVEEPVYTSDAYRFYSPYQYYPLKLDKVYFEDSEDMIEEGGYPKSFHVWTADSYSGIPLFKVTGGLMCIPCLLEDIVACNSVQVAGRIIYLFSPKTWREYQQREPILIREDGEVEVEIPI